MISITGIHACMVCRYSELEMARIGDDVRVTGEAFLVKGDVALISLDGRVVKELRAPNMLEAGAYSVVLSSVV